MTARARGPRILKGALVTIAPGGGAPDIVAFGYNPASLKRSLQPQTAGGETQDRSGTVRFTGPPVQTITVEIDIDATDALASGVGSAMVNGALPALARLEQLVYPALDQVRQTQAQLAQGVMEIAPITAPRTLFVWGSQRVLPVRITGFDIDEEFFDAKLNPIRARVTLVMRVLTYWDVGPDDRAGLDFMTYQQTLESLADGARASAGSAMIGVDTASY